MLTSKDPRLAGRVAFTHPNFVSYTLARFFIVVALEMQSVAVGWQVYATTNRPLDLGYVGLAQFAPGFILFLFAGHAADLFDRRKLLMWCYIGYGLCSALLLAISWRAPHSVHLICAVLYWWGFPQFQLSGKPRHPAATGSRRTLPERRRLECQHVSDRYHCRSGDRRHRLRSFPRAGDGLRHCRRRLDSFHLPDFSHPYAAISPEKQRVVRDPISLHTVLAGFRFIREKKLILGPFRSTCSPCY